MKVLHINCNYIATTLHQLMVRELTEQGIENEVFVPVYDPDIGVIDPDENVTVCRCFNKRDRAVFDYKQRKIIRAIEEHYDIADFDLIHAYTLFTDGNVARVLSEKYGVPYVVAVRNTDVNAFFKNMVHLRGRGVKNMLSASRVFFLSDSYRNTVFERYVPEKYRESILKKTEIIPNGIDDYWLSNSYSERDYEKALRRIHEKRLSLVYAGNIDRNKNITLTCRAMDILKRDGWSVELTAVGKIADRKVYEQIEDKVRYISKKPKEELIEYYRRADIFVMPSISESFGLVYAEAMSQGLPVIYTRGQGFDMQFPEGRVGYSVSSDDEKELAEKIKLVAESYETISRQAAEEVKRFSWDMICKRYADIYFGVKA